VCYCVKDSEDEAGCAAGAFEHSKETYLGRFFLAAKKTLGEYRPKYQATLNY
jgi:hypothetical protein